MIRQVAVTCETCGVVRPTYAHDFFLLFQSTPNSLRGLRVHQGLAE